MNKAVNKVKKGKKTMFTWLIEVVNNKIKQLDLGFM